MINLGCNTEHCNYNTAQRGAAVQHNEYGTTPQCYYDTIRYDTSDCANLRDSLQSGQCNIMMYSASPTRYCTATQQDAIRSRATVPYQSVQCEYPCHLIKHTDDKQHGYSTRGRIVHARLPTYKLTYQPTNQAINQPTLPTYPPAGHQAVV